MWCSWFVIDCLTSIGILLVYLVLFSLCWPLFSQIYFPELRTTNTFFLLSVVTERIILILIPGVSVHALVGCKSRMVGILHHFEDKVLKWHFFR